MTGMRSDNFVTRNNAGLPGNNPLTHKTILDAEHNLATETNDLGRVLSEVANMIKTQGITTAPPPGNVVKLVSLTENAVNIASRMERDIVIEEQMIEKI
jgi:hypothetical protein